MNRLTHRDASPLVAGRLARSSRVIPASTLPSSRGGFTLVEMLVATALILMMMSMFATIFLISTGSMTRQRSLTESDQRNRMLATLLRSDLQRRTYRADGTDAQRSVGIVPWHPSIPDNAPEILALNAAQKGYIELIENDPNDDLDDILQLTVQIDGTKEGRYYGRADELTNAGATGGFAANPNQPEADDGQVTTNRTAQSSAAEVAWFVRNGNLYRRVMLLREPLSWAPSFDVTPHYGPNGDTLPFIPKTATLPAVFVSASLGTSVTVPTNSFYNHFDMSAHYDNQSSVTPNGLSWHSLSWLNNNHGTGHVPNGGFLLGTEEGTSLGLPNWRFGHCPRRGGALAGFPRPGEGVEFVGAPGNMKYIGRFTHEETSADDFRYPGNGQAGADAVWGTNDDKNPLTRRSNQLTLNGIGVVSQLPGGARRGEDLVMSGVLAFDIKVWDDHMGAFVDLGHQLQKLGVNGDYHADRVLNPNYSPSAPPRFRFDTWHPEVKLNPTSPSFELPPFRPATLGLDMKPGIAMVVPGMGDDDGDGTEDNAEELGWYGTDDVVKPLRAVQMRVRFKVPGTDDVREITIVHSFREAS